LFRCPQLARTLRNIADGGRDAFYTGPVADAIVGFSEITGGLLSKEDLAQHRTDFTDPLRGSYRGFDVLAMPPNSQGIAALDCLAILEGFDIASLQHGSADLMHLQMEAMKIALLDAHRLVADPSVSTAADLIRRGYIESRRAGISPTRASSEPGTAATHGDTVYITAVDPDGNAASFINSVYMPWGSGYTVPEMGIVLQNRGHCFSLDPSSPNAYGPGKRSRHTLSPAMVLSEGRPLLVFGFVGGDMQVQAQVQFLCNVIDFGMNVQEALDAPRWRYEGKGAAVALEASVPSDVRSELAKRGHQITGCEGFFGGGQAIFVDPEFKTLQAGSDSRRDGCAIGY